MLHIWKNNVEKIECCICCKKAGVAWKICIKTWRVSSKARLQFDFLWLFRTRLNFKFTNYGNLICLIGWIISTLSWHFMQKIIGWEKRYFWLFDISMRFGNLFWLLLNQFFVEWRMENSPQHSTSWMRETHTFIFCNFLQ